MYIVAFFIGFLFWKSCKFWRRLRALDYIWKSGVGFTLFYFTNLFVEILGRKGSGTMIFIVSWCYGGLAMVIFILFWQGSYPPWWHHTGILWLILHLAFAWSGFALRGNTRSKTTIWREKWTRKALKRGKFSSGFAYICWIWRWHSIEIVETVRCPCQSVLLEILSISGVQIICCFLDMAGLI